MYRMRLYGLVAIRASRCAHHSVLLSDIRMFSTVLALAYLLLNYMLINTLNFHMQLNLFYIFRYHFVAAPL
jgi:hypothetical protein